MTNDKEETWSKRFQEPVDKLMHRFNASLSFDRRLARHDIRASIAHARMLGATGIISKQDSKYLLVGLAEIDAQMAAGEFKWDDRDEDVHTAIERVLTENIGEAGKRLHTARSRNDQVSTDLRLWLRDEIDALLVDIARVRASLLSQACDHVDTVMPGMTHLQVAQPTTLAHHLHAHTCMLERDATRLTEIRTRVNMLPLGAAALAGTSFPIEPRMVAQELGFSVLCPNTMDAVADRDYVCETVFACALLIVHLSRLCEEIIIWSSQPFAFVRVGDGYCTGSSIMPQKRNPDAAELIRAKSGRVTGSVVALLMQAKGQPLAYNKDNQEDKEALFDSVDTVRDCLVVMAGMLTGLKFDTARMAQLAEAGYATATDVADLLVREGMPFRDAHSKVAALVAAAEQEQVGLSALSDERLSELSGVTATKLRKVLDPKIAVQSRTGHGNPAPQSMLPVLEQALILAQQQATGDTGKASE